MSDLDLEVSEEDNHTGSEHAVLVEVPRRGRGRPKKNSISFTKNLSDDRIKGFYFKVKADLRLLTLVLELNPYKDKYAWENIVQKMRNDGYRTSQRQCKDRIDRLLFLYQYENLASINKKATEEEYERRKNLIRQVKSCKESGRSTHITRENVHILRRNIHVTRNEHSESSEHTAKTEPPETLTPGLLTLEYCSDTCEEQDEISESMASESTNEFTCSTSNQPLKRRKADSTDDALLEKARMDHELQMRKLQASIDEQVRHHEIESKKIELEKKRMLLENESRQQHAQLIERIVTLQQQAATRDEGFKQEFIKMSQTIMSFVSKILDKEAK